MAFPKSRTDPPKSNLDQAEQRWRAVDGKFAQLTQSIERRQIALSLHRNPDDARDESRTAWARSYAAEFIQIARRRPDRVEREILDLTDQLDDIRAEHAAARVELEHQRAVATSEIAVELQPRQRQAVQRIAAALEALSRSLADANEINAELARRAPLPTSAFLPFITGELCFAALGDPNSAASAWARRMKSIGILSK